MNASYALVTGASKGLGAGMARHLADRGYSLLLVARNESQLHELADQLPGDHHRTLAGDLSESTTIDRLLQLVKDEALEIEVLINNAGFGDVGAILDRDWTLYQTMMRLNMESLTRLSQHFGQIMEQRGNGYIMNVASTGAFQPNPNFAVYGASKAFVLNFSEAFNEELKGSGVSVTCLCPGPTRTEFHDRAQSGDSRIVRVLMMETDDVVKIGIDAMFARRGTVIPGPANAVLTFTERFTPRWLVPKMAKYLMSS